MLVAQIKQLVAILYNRKRSITFQGTLKHFTSTKLGVSAKIPQPPQPILVHLTLIGRNSQSRSNMESGHQTNLLNLQEEQPGLEQERTTFTMLKATPTMAARLSSQTKRGLHSP